MIPGVALRWACVLLAVASPARGSEGGKGGKGGDKEGRPTGMLLWSHGRSATDTLAQTLKATGDYKWCYGEKESFSHHRLSADNLGICFAKPGDKSNRAERGPGFKVMHVKPVHLLRPSSAIRTPAAFMRALAQLGGAIKLVVVVRRANQLARLVSSCAARARARARATRRLL